MGYIMTGFKRLDLTWAFTPTRNIWAFEQRKELRVKAQARWEAEKKQMEAPAVEVRTETPIPTEKVTDEVTDTVEIPVAVSQDGTMSLFPDMESEEEKRRKKEELMQPREFDRPLEPHHRDGSLVVDTLYNPGYLKDVTTYGAMFHPLDLSGVQREKAQLYVSLRDAYERLYTYETENHEENAPQRGYLNKYYDEYVARYGNLNSRQNVKLIMMDATGRDILSLERSEEGKFVKADIFERPVAFAVDNVTHVETPEEALSASLNKSGGVNID